MEEESLQHDYERFGVAKHRPAGSAWMGSAFSGGKRMSASITLSQRRQIPLALAPGVEPHTLRIVSGFANVPSRICPCRASRSASSRINLVCRTLAVYFTER